MMKNKIYPLLIGTRGSPLAMWQALQIKNKLRQGEIKKISTSADKMQNKSLVDIGGKGLFTKELDEAILKEKIHMAVHSLKDVPTFLPKNINLSYILPRGSISDVLISKKNVNNIHNLPSKAKIGTSSPRRYAQIKNIRPDIQVIPIRGNIHTRLKKLKKNELDAIILALAGIKRLNIEINYTILRGSSFLPTVGQGIIAVTYLKTNNVVKNILNPHIHNSVNHQAVAERAVLRKLNGDCHSSIAVNSKIKNDKIHISCIVYSKNGKSFIKESIYGEIKDSSLLGKELGEKLITLGSLKLLNNEK